MLQVDDRETRNPRSFTLKPSTVKILEELAEAYNTNASRIVEAMVVQYGPKFLEHAKREKA